MWNGAVRLITTHLLAPCRMFWVFYSTGWIVDLYHQLWRFMWQLLPCFISHRAGNRSIGIRWWWVFLSGARRLHPPRFKTASLSALSSKSSALCDPDAHTSVCPVRALWTYTDRSASFRQSDQLFVCYGGCAKGQAVSKQRISHWIVEAIKAAYMSQGLECPLHIRGHSTRATASSLPWSRGMSEINIFF